MTRTTTFITSLAIALAFPAIASAHCGTTQGSFAVTCEQGVKVYRHNALSSIPRGVSMAQAKVKAAESRERTERARLAQTERAQIRTNALLERQLDITERRVRISERNSRRRSIGYGYTLARPIRVRNPR